MDGWMGCIQTLSRGFTSLESGGEHLFQIYRRLIGRPYIAIARQDKIYRNISNALGRTKYISQYIGCVQEAQIRT